jgi:uncharacterized protein (DUF2235 family)
MDRYIDVEARANSRSACIMFMNGIKQEVQAARLFDIRLYSKQ